MFGLKVHEHEHVIIVQEVFKYCWTLLGNESSIYRSQIVTGFTDHCRYMGGMVWYGCLGMV